jgi:hypothetical protein
VLSPFGSLGNRLGGWICKRLARQVDLELHPWLRLVDDVHPVYLPPPPPKKENDR